MHVRRGLVSFREVMKMGKGRDARGRVWIPRRRALECLEEARSSPSRRRGECAKRTEVKGNEDEDEEVEKRCHRSALSNLRCIEIRV